MATTNQQILDAARSSLLRILQTDTSSWSEGERQKQSLEIRDLEAIIARYEPKVAAESGRRIFQPITRVDV